MTEGPGAHVPRGRFTPFGRLWASTAVSALGDGVRLTALPLLALSLTTDPLLISLVTVANWLPLLLSPLAGVWADLADRRSLLIGIDLLRAAAVLVLTLTVVTGVVSLPVVCAVAAVLGLGETVHVVASQSYLPMVVTTDRLAAANGRLHVAQLIFRDSAGQPLGSLAFVAGAGLPFLIDGVSFLLGVVLLVTLPRFPAPVGRTTGPGDAPRWRTMILDGVRLLRTDRLLATLAGMLGALNFFMGVTGTLEVLYVVRWLGLPEAAFGVFLAVGALGGIVGGLLNSRLAGRFGLFPAALGGMVLMGVAMLLTGLVRHALVAAAGFALMTLGAAVYQALTVSFRQATTPPDQLGRLNGVYRLVGTGTIPLGALAGGAVAKLVEVNIPYVAAGAGVLLLFVLVARPVVRMGAAQEQRAGAPEAPAEAAP
ncbi:MFS transporter [Streptomyces albofaciens JCM 4342]|uniref:MFS transporter n=1 Tax=Streptomyces albofaciens TaxID=66866 RepID=UPI0012394A60|nr:MFS transporter [Streptomyces albofaciens]KAA6213990.1 MFS transporter [Streptomyces albofaciens JCM 4342]